MKSFGNNSYIFGFVSKNLWNLFLFQKPVSAMSMVVGLVYQFYFDIIPGIDFYISLWAFNAHRSNSNGFSCIVINYHVVAGCSSISVQASFAFVHEYTNSLSRGRFLPIDDDVLLSSSLIFFFLLVYMLNVFVLRLILFQSS